MFINQAGKVLEIFFKLNLHKMNGKKKILIYDSSRGYARFIKLNFKDFEVNNFSEYHNYKDINADDFEAVFFIVNNHIELLDLICFQSKKTLIFIGSPLPEINTKTESFDNVIFLDLQRSKKFILDFIKLFFNIYQINGSATI